VSTSLGITLDSAGSRRTSSNVSARGSESMREPAFSGRGWRLTHGRRRRVATGKRTGRGPARRPGKARVSGLWSTA
jgi:hypothetical protein